MLGANSATVQSKWRPFVGAFQQPLWGFALGLKGYLCLDWISFAGWSYGWNWERWQVWEWVLHEGREASGWWNSGFFLSKFIDSFSLKKLHGTPSTFGFIMYLQKRSNIKYISIFSEKINVFNKTCESLLKFGFANWDQTLKQYIFLIIQL